MFGLRLRTYRRKIQRMTESVTVRGRSLWEVVLEHIREHALVTRLELLQRFASDDEAQVRAVLHDLCESQLVFSSGTGSSTSYRLASEAELASLKHMQSSEGADELLLALMFREGAFSVAEIAAKAQAELAETEAALARLVAAGRVERRDEQGAPRYETKQLVIPLGAPVGWEAAVFDHFKALVTTILSRLRENRSAAREDRIGGSTYTIDVWDGHPLADEVVGVLGRMRASLSDLRTRVSEHNATCPLPDRHTRVVIYVGQSLIAEGGEDVD